MANLLQGFKTYAEWSIYPVFLGHTGGERGPVYN